MFTKSYRRHREKVTPRQNLQLSRYYIVQPPPLTYTASVFRFVVFHHDPSDGHASHGVQAAPLGYRCVFVTDRVIELELAALFPPENLHEPDEYRKQSGHPSNRITRCPRCFVTGQTE